MIDYELKRSNKKNISVQVTPNGKVLVKAPPFASKWFINSFVKKNSDWINEQLKMLRDQMAKAQPELTEEEINNLKNQAREYIIPKVREYAEIMGLEYGNIKITSAKKRFGSCHTGTHNLCFSYFLIQKPKYAVDYVIVHELAHIVHPNHSKSFYDYIEKFMPDYKERIKLLKCKEEI